jgi:hypothetical protein
MDGISMRKTQINQKDKDHAKAQSRKEEKTRKKTYEFRQKNLGQKNDALPGTSKVRRKRWSIPFSSFCP